MSRMGVRVGGSRRNKKKVLPLARLLNCKSNPFERTPDNKEIEKKYGEARSGSIAPLKTAGIENRGAGRRGGYFKVMRFLSA